MDLCASDPSMATISNVSSKYQDIISKSLLLRSGSPSIYQLKPKKETFGTLTKLTVGEKDVNKVNKTIFLVGETGAGKSTLINALVNHTMGVKWEDKVWFKIVEQEEEKKEKEKEKKKSQAESQTSDVIVYQVLDFEGKTLPYSLTIIDTPGFGDTRGVERDNIIIKRLLDWFRSPDGVHEVNAVGLVMKASENRVNDRVKYIFDSIMSLFGKNIEKNIVALITHSSGTYPENVLNALKTANIKCARDEDDDPVYFLFENCLNRQRTKKEEFGLKNAWRVTDEGMNQFMTFLKETGPQKLDKTVEVMNDRVKLTACIQNLQERIKTIELKQKAIKQTEKALKKHEEEKKKPEEFIVEVDQSYRVKQSIEGGWRWFGGKNGALTCNVCEENCHYPCTVAAKAGHCDVMSGGHCTVCRGRCDASDHVKETFIYVDRTRKVKKTLEDMKQQYERQYQADKGKKLSLLENLKAEKINLETDKTQWLEEAYKHVVNLEKIALKADSGSTYVHLDFLIEKMKEKGDKEKVQKLEEMKKRQEEGNKGALCDEMNQLGKQ